ncbi:MAG: hypothetical protein E5X35_07305 [Mesorhizobium sp.]|uniref:hypothetical protein n=1 Tax=Mesorhizobium TaxID=68287 RepID=UPI0011F63983|nr:MULTISPECIES: hypothetical protein [Mesorhizobium]MCF6120834.1 hypothetical protein [Mesorhizobium muleiense]TIR34515.1 MAG: hypothetical protein E5X35_07305 [Mesorhizobium sp.]
MSNKSQNNRDQKTGRTAQASPEGVPCGGVSRQDQVAADTLARVAAFLKERDETLMPDEADDEERVESAKCILEAIAALSTQPVPVAAVTDSMVHAYKRSFGEYMDKSALGHITPPTPDVGFHATKYALGVALAPAAQAVPGDMVEREPPAAMPNETERLVRASQWLQKRWSQKDPNTAHIRQLADYEAFLAGQVSLSASNEPQPLAGSDSLQRQRDEALAALTAIYQRGNESGTGEMGLIDTIHDMCGIARDAISKAEGWS